MNGYQFRRIEAITVGNVPIRYKPQHWHDGATENRYQLLKGTTYQLAWLFIAIYRKRGHN